ncbi:MAG: ferritin-like domain-containing protein [Myxococcales bacterium]
MKKSTGIGMNRTGMATSPLQSKMMLAGAALPTSSPRAGLRALTAARTAFARVAGPIGTMPPPASLREAGTAAMKALKGEKATVFVDKLGERLAFERTGCRLYEALLVKHDARGGFPGGPSRRDLEQIHADELSHFHMLEEIATELGTDPTAMTPSADIVAVASEGLPHVVADPRTDLLQGLEAILIAELSDNACWENLGVLARLIDMNDLAERFDEAISTEHVHLRRVRGWIEAGLEARLRGPARAAAQVADRIGARTSRTGGTRRGRAPDGSARGSRTSRTERATFQGR